MGYTLEIEMERTSRGPVPLSVVMMDVNDIREKQGRAVRANRLEALREWAEAELKAKRAIPRAYGGTTVEEVCFSMATRF